jgi:hypothetical protein
MKPGDAVIAIKHIRSNNPSSPEHGRIIPKGYIDIIVTVNDEWKGIGLQNDKDPAGYFWGKDNFRLLAEESELDNVLRELELSILN